MKRPVSLIVVLVCGLLTLGEAGCGKKQQTRPLEQVSLDLRTSLGSNKQLQSIYFDVVETGVRYGRYQDAIAGLGQIGNDPSATAKQKKLANEFAEMLRSKVGGTNQ
jgi:hypothetical protein